MKKDHLREFVENGSDCIMYIDDNPLELEMIHEAGLPITLVRMLRDGEARAEQEHALDDDVWMCVSSLEEVKEQI